MIPFNKPPFIGEEMKYIKNAVENNKICGDGEYTKLCNKLMEKSFNSKKVLLTTSGTHALEMAAMLCNIKPGDEVIMPSYTFVSTANAFLLQGAKVLFVDIRPDTLNIDENLIEQAITKNTKAIVPVHYAGIGCEMDKINEIGKRYNIKIVEDAAQGVMAKYKNKYLGTIGDFGCYSFHETKNYSMGEGGAILVRDDSFVDRAEHIREKGTNRSNFFRGQVDKYTWVDKGSSYLPSELNAAYLYAQLENLELINNKRLSIWEKYFTALKKYEDKIDLPFVPEYCKHNAHMFYIKLKDLEQRTKYIDHMRENNIITVFHYIPLHSSPAGRKYSKFIGEDKFTTKESERLVRLPLFYSLTDLEQEKVIEKTIEFIKKI